MSKSRAIDQRVAPADSRGAADEYPRRGRRRIRQDADARRAHGRWRRRGVYQVEHMAAVTFTRKAASELRGRFHLALERGAAAAGCPAGSADRERIAFRSALSNLERFFAGTIHSFCARLLRERPVESGVSPGFTELDEVQDLELRQRAWRDFITSARAAGDPDMMALLEADVRPQGSRFRVRDRSASTRTSSSRRARPSVPIRRRRGRRSRSSGRSCRSICRPKSTRRRPARFRRRRVSSEGSCACRATGSIALRSSPRCSRRGTSSRRSSRTGGRRLAGGEEAAARLIQRAPPSFHARRSQPYLAQWRQYVYRLSVTLLTRARESAAAERRRLNSLNYGDLLNLTARVLRENANGAPGAAAEVPAPVRRRVPGHRSGAGGDRVLAGRGRAGLGRETEAIADWRNVPLRSRRAVRRRRPEAVDLPLPPRRHRHLQHRPRSASAIRPSAASLPLTMNFRSVPQLCTWANEVFQDAVPGGTDVARASVRRARSDTSRHGDLPVACSR